MNEQSIPLTTLLALIAVLPGCADEDEDASVAGTYEVVSHTLDDDGCDGPGQAVDGGTPYFELTEESFLGAQILGWHDCSAADSCDDTISLDKSFEDDGGEWIAKSVSAGGSAFSCSITLVEGTITDTEDGVSIEFRTYSGQLDLDAASGEACETELADTRRSDLACERVEIFDGVRL